MSEATSGTGSAHVFPHVAALMRATPAFIGCSSCCRRRSHFSSAYSKPQTISGARISKIRHYEERSDDAIQSFHAGPGLLRYARNDEACSPDERSDIRDRLRACAPACRCAHAGYAGFHRVFLMLQTTVAFFIAHPKPQTISGARISKIRHCEERSDEAIQSFHAALDCFASLAMTAASSPDERSDIRGPRMCSRMSLRSCGLRAGDDRGRVKDE